MPSKLEFAKLLQLEKGRYVLNESMQLITFFFVKDSSSISRQPGDRWMILGPREYVPPVEVKVLHMNKAIPLDENEGIYVRDVKTGKVCN